MIQNTCPMCNSEDIKAHAENNTYIVNYHCENCEHNWSYDYGVRFTGKPSNRRYCE